MPTKYMSRRSLTQHILYFLVISYYRDYQLFAVPKLFSKVKKCCDKCSPFELDCLFSCINCWDYELRKPLSSRKASIEEDNTTLTPFFFTDFKDRAKKSYDNLELAPDFMENKISQEMSGNPQNNTSELYLHDSNFEHSSTKIANEAIENLDWEALLIDTKDFLSSYPHIFPCCADCESTDMFCLSTCQKYDCQQISRCAKAGQGAYSKYCQSKCSLRRALIEVTYLPKLVCRNFCSTVTHHYCYLDSCRSFGCYAENCLEEVSQACN